MGDHYSMPIEEREAGPTAGSAGARRGMITRERLLRAAWELLREHGVEGFSTRAVARQAGVVHSMLHYHFKDRRELILDLMVLAREEWITPLEEIAAGRGSAESRLRKAIAWWAEPATANMMRAHLSLFHFALSDEATRRQLAQEYERFAAPFIKLFGELSKERVLAFDPVKVGEAFATAADGLVERQVLDPSIRVQDYLISLLDLLLGPRSVAASPR